MVHQLAGQGLVLEQVFPEDIDFAGVADAVGEDVHDLAFDCGAEAVEGESRMSQLSDEASATTMEERYTPRRLSRRSHRP